MSVEKFRRAEDGAGKELNFMPEKTGRMDLYRDRRTVADGMIGKAEEKRQKNKNILKGEKRK